MSLSKAKGNNVNKRLLDVPIPPASSHVKIFFVYVFFGFPGHWTTFPHRPAATSLTGKQKALTHTQREREAKERKKRI